MTMPTKTNSSANFSTKSSSKKKSRIGSDFEDFLQEQGRLEESTALAMKRVLAWEFNEAMKKAEISQAEMARRMGTSRAVVRRLLDQNETSVTLATISRAATALGRNMSFQLAR
jgi:antitoxin HicB